MNFNCDAKRARRAVTAATLAVALGAGIAAADTDAPVYDLAVRGGRFEPSTLEVEAGKAFQIRLTNADAAAIEFECFELHRERVVQPNETITVLVPGVGADTYKFFDDFHPDTPPGAIVAK